jgi:hypothetical protein
LREQPRRDLYPRRTWISAESSRQIGPLDSQISSTEPAFRTRPRRRGTCVSDIVDVTFDPWPRRMRAKFAVWSSQQDCAGESGGKLAKAFARRRCNHRSPYFTGLKRFQICRTNPKTLSRAMNRVVSGDDLAILRWDSARPLGGKVQRSALPNLRRIYDARATDRCRERAKSNGIRSAKAALVEAPLIERKSAAGLSALMPCSRANPGGSGLTAHSRETLFSGQPDGPKSAACGMPPRRAYRPCWRRGRVAEGGGLLNRYRVVKPYRGFESLRLRHLLL